MFRQGVIVSPTRKRGSNNDAEHAGCSASAGDTATDSVKRRNPGIFFLAAQVGAVLES